MPVLSRARHVRCDGAFNLRDLGGYPTTDGRRVRWQVLYRADGLHRVPAAGLATVGELGLRTVLDLRTTGEHDAGAFVVDGTTVLHLPILRATWGIPDAAEIDPVAFLSEHYQRMLDEGAGAIATAFEVLASPVRLPAAFHCSAGKDRTGVLAALVLAALGVPDDVIAADYARSAAAIEELVAWLVATGRDGAEEMPRQPKALLACPPEAMHAFLAGVRSRFGSPTGYLRTVGVTEEVLAGLREALLEPA